MVTDERLERIRKTAANRQEDFTIIVENVHDPHNLGAVLRTCDSVGIHEIYAIYSIESPQLLKNLRGNKSSSGAKKWVEIHYYDNAVDCFTAVRKKYDAIYGTHLSHDATSLYDLDLTNKVALLFGNEHRGVSEEALALLDGNFIIPQVGMVQSLNISVACAVSLYEAMRQRIKDKRYGGEYDPTNKFQTDLEDLYIKRTRKL